MQIIGRVRVGDRAACGGTAAEGLSTSLACGQTLAFRGPRMQCRKQDCVDDLCNGRRLTISSGEGLFGVIGRGLGLQSVHLPLTNIGYSDLRNATEIMCWKIKFRSHSDLPQRLSFLSSVRSSPGRHARSAVACGSDSTSRGSFRAIGAVMKSATATFRGGWSSCFSDTSSGPR